MPQAALPDLNTGYITYRREIISGIRSRNYSVCFGSLYALNALLPVDYQVKISTATYELMTKTETLINCISCKEDSNIKTIKRFKLLQSRTTFLLSRKQYEEVWICPKCKKTNIFLENDVMKQVISTPTFFGVVPRPPSPKSGIADRGIYEKNVTRWIYLFLDELEHKMSKYRLEYVPKSEEEKEEDAHIDRGDEEIEI